MKSFTRVFLPCLLAMICFIVTPASAQLTAGFTATPLTGCPPMVVAFKDTSKGSPTSWRWDLGNGTISFVQDPIATYFNPGVYNIKLVVKNAAGSDSVTKSQYIVVNQVPTVNFGSSDTTGCFPLKVSFYDSSTAGSGTISSWQWDFGDGTLSTQQNPQHTYTAAGLYNVTLRVVNSKGCSKVVTKNAFVRLLNGVKADFTYASAAGCHSPTPVAFTNTSNGTGALTYQWSFGDGSTSTQENPVHSYLAAGSYSVKLIVTNSFGCSDTVLKVNAIQVGFVKANFTKPDSVCVNAPLNILNTSTPSSVAATWYFGDGSSSTSISPVKVYTTPGVYQIKLVNDFGSCLDSITKTVVVLPKPLAQFSGSNTTGCQLPHTVFFTNNSVGGATYSWNFGDGGTSTSISPSHQYLQAGEFTVTLIVTNANGCTDTVVKPQFIKIIPPQVLSIQDLPVKGCIPYSVSPQAVIQSLQPITSYFWDFGDGTTSTLQFPNHTYTIPGIYNVKVVVSTASGCKDSLTMTGAVKVGKKPVAQFSGVPRDVCAFKPINFTDETTNGPIHDWLWTFGDGGSSIEQNPIYAYNDTGRFTVTLIVYNFGCSDTIRKVDYMYIKPPIASFDTAFRCNDRLTRNFIDKSIGANTWAWKFGDGTVSTAQNPTHTYATPGTYNVELLVSNGACEHLSRRNVLVIKEEGNVTMSDSITCRNARINFNVGNINTANISDYTWYFDGLSASPVVTTNNPVARNYGIAGTYYPAVMIRDLLNCKDTLSTVLPIKVYGPTANFFSNVEGTCFGNIVRFPDSSTSDGTHPIINYNWNFGNGIIQNYAAGPFSHLYDTTGVYDVKLIVKDSYGCLDSMMKPQLVTITKPKAAILVSDTLVCPSTPITFTNNSQGLQATYSWNFGDGTTSSQFTTSHSYINEGLYVVKMVMVDKFGCSDSVTTQVRVFKAVADFLMSDSFSTCPPLVVNFTNKSTSFVEMEWDFGDGGTSTLNEPSHIYTYPGTFIVKLKVKNNGGCVDVITKRVRILGPSGVFSYTPLEYCTPSVVTYSAVTQNTVKYIWDFNDGNTTFNTTPATNHTYTIAGTYLPKLILEDASGCRVPIPGIDTIKVLGITTNIQADNKVLCDSGTVSFTEITNSNDGIAGFKWDFGDGTTSTVRNPVKRYSTTGLYSVKLVAISRFGCTDTAFYKGDIKVVNSPKVRIVGDTSACEPALITLQSGFVRTDTSAVTWLWNFGNGQTSVLPSPPAQTYQNAGLYPISLTAINSDGCKDSTARRVLIHPKPVVDAGIDTVVCRNSSIQLNATGAANYTWTANPGLSCSNCPSPTATPDTLTTYYVRGNTVFGCTAQDSVRVQVQRRLRINVASADTLCVGQSVSLRASGAERYEWFPSTWLDNPAIASPRSTPASTIRYSVIGHDSRNCFADTGFINLKVYPIPRISIKVGQRINLTSGASVKLETQNSGDVTRWNWFPNVALSCSTCPEPVASPKQNITYTVTATNDGACVARDQVTVTMICDNGNVFIPNTFSPNSNGTNDAFYPRGSGIMSVKSMKVFNRWGQIVFQRSNFDANNAAQGWDGKFNSVDVQTDVYVYLIEIVCENQVIIPLKGNVTLLR